MPKTIVITGTATGMGRATVSKFAAEGWNVVATVRKESDLKAHDGLRCVNTPSCWMSMMRRRRCPSPGSPSSSSAGWMLW